MPPAGRVITIRLPPLENILVAAFVLLLPTAFLALIVAGWILSPAQAPDVALVRSDIPNAQLASPALNARVEDLLRQMTLSEKIGQLTQYSAGVLTGPAAANRPNFDQMIARGQVGSLFNVVGAKLTNHYQKIALEKSPLHIPLLFGYDVIHGEHTIFPVPLALSSSFDPGLVESVARTSAQEASADGIRWVFSPMVDIARDARWGRITEGAGEDTFLGSILARAYVRGYQGTT